MTSGKAPSVFVLIGLDWTSAGLMRRPDYQFHYVVAHGKAEPLVQTATALGRPENDCVHLARLTPIKRGAQQLRSDATATRFLLDKKVSDVRVMFCFGSWIRNLFDQLKPDRANHSPVNLRNPALPRGALQMIFHPD